MNNKELFDIAKDILSKVNPESLETIQLNHTKYDDGSIGFTIDLSYPEQETTEETSYNGTKDIK